MVCRRAREPRRDREKMTLEPAPALLTRGQAMSRASTKPGRNPTQFSAPGFTRCASAARFGETR